MMLLERHLAVTVTRTIAMTLLTLVILLVFFNLLEELSDVGKGQYGVVDAFLVALMAAPRYLFEVFPVAALIGSLLGLGGLASHNELMVMRASGFSLRRIMTTLVKIGLAMILVIGATGELLAPMAQEFATQHKFEKQQGQATLKSRFGFWTRDGNAFVNIRNLASGRHLEDIFIYEFDGEGRLVLATHAGAADYLEDRWILRDIEQSRIGEQQVLTSRQEQAQWDSLLDPSLLSVVVIDPSVLPIRELGQYIDYLGDNGQSAIDYEVAFWGKLVNPLATLLMLLLAVPFVLGSQRSVSMGQRILLGVLVGAGFFLFTRAMTYLPVVYDFNPAVTAIMPALILFGVIAGMLRRV